MTPRAPVGAKNADSLRDVMADDHEDHHREEDEGGERPHQDPQLLLHTQHGGEGLVIFTIRINKQIISTRHVSDKVKHNICY